jgi:hypothetical protein
MTTGTLTVMPPAPVPLNIYQRVAAVMKEVAYVQKDTSVTEGGNYKAVTHDMVTAVVRPHFVKFGIVIQPRVVHAEFIDTGRKSSRGNPAMRYEGRFEVDFVNIDNPVDRITITVDAHADDYGDKAPGKALSYAVKGAVLKLLMLETGENDESRIAPDVSLTDEQAAALDVLRSASMEGSTALKAAWEAAGKPMRLDLAPHLDALRAAAKEADEITAKGAGNVKP